MATTLDHISRRPGHPGHRRGVVRDRARGVRARVRRWLPGAAALARRGPADHARDAPRRDARAQPGRAIAPRTCATTRRRSRSACRCSSVAAASRSRSSSWPATATRTTSAAASRTSSARRRILVQHCETVGRDPAEIERTTRPRDGHHPRLPGRGRAGPARDRSSATAGRELWKDQPVGHAGGRRRAHRAVPRASATGTSSPGSRRPYDEESMTRLADRGPAAGSSALG